MKPTLLAQQGRWRVVLVPRSGVASVLVEKNTPDSLGEPCWTVIDGRSIPMAGDELVPVDDCPENGGIYKGYDILAAQARRIRRLVEVGSWEPVRSAYQRLKEALDGNQ